MIPHTKKKSSLVLNHFSFFKKKMEGKNKLKLFSEFFFSFIYNEAKFKSFMLIFNHTIKGIKNRLLFQQRDNHRIFSN